ncbi:MAG: short-chain fatty acyl-CoA regulator family protein [Polyangiales bacterium]
MGSRLRELRLQRGLPQGEAARRLSISPAYLSLLEKGKRTVQLPVLFKALELYGATMESFMMSLGEARVDDGLARLLDEPLMRSLNLSEDDLSAIGSEPKMATTITALFNLYKNTRSQLDNVLQGVAQTQEGDDSLRFDYSPFDEVTDFLQENRNYFESLEERATRFRVESGLRSKMSSEALIEALQSHAKMTIELRGDHAESSVVRRWNLESRTLIISEHMDENRLKFQLAHALGLLIFDEEKLHKPILAEYRGKHAETRRLIKIHLANYFAGALLLPYDEFFAEVLATRYDVELLAERFRSTYEMVAHRMCNLSAPKKSAVPMHFLRVDVAGNISKRYSGDGIHFAHQQGSCPKMAVHQAFLTPNMITKQYSSFPDGTTYFCFAKVITETLRGSLVQGTTYSIGLGVHAEDAKHLAYADEMPFVDPVKMSVPVGSSCRFCERTDCNMRSAPSYKFAFVVDANTKKDNFFSPIVRGDSD